MTNYSTIHGDLIIENNVGIGTSSPTAVLHLKAGTSTANTAPLKFTAGTALTTPETGVIEFHNSRFYITNVGTRRAIDRTADVITSTTTVANTTNETTIYTGAVPANSMSAGNIIKLYLDGIVSTVSAADTVTVKIKLGGATISTTTSAGAVLTNDCWHGAGVSTVREIGASGSLAWHFDIDFKGVNSEACGIAAADTTAAANITVTVQWNNAKAGNTISLYQGFLEYKN